MRRCSMLLAAFVLIGSTVVLGPRSEAAPKAPLTIQAGAIPKGDAPYEFDRFYPDVVKIHRGQTVRVNIFGFHTVTYSKVGRAGFFRADEIPGTYAFPEESFTGSDCGRGTPCVLTPKTTFAGSAAPFFSEAPVDVKVDLPPGRYTYFCQIHATMKGTFDVVPDSVATTTQAQANSQIASAVRKDTATADALYRKDQVPTSKVDADGVRTWRVLVGDSSPDDHVQILAYMPGALKIAAGDRVHYEMRSTFSGDPHTVTFPTEATGTDMLPLPNGLAGLSINLSCDPDDPKSGAPGVLGFWGVVGPPCPGNLEAVWAPWMTSAHAAPGNLVLTPATYHDSGTLAGAHLPRNFRGLPGGATLPSSFDAEFPNAGSFTWACDIHGAFMTGTIDAS